jgi:DNA-binding winged helix-turn-helix (wHTH) protein/tetratricopeptide (TPR) repeat protein
MHGLRYRFESFELNPGERTLSLGDMAVRLSGKPFELLLLLVAAKGAAVTRREAIAALWPDTAVHENSLAVVVSTLRQGLAAACPESALIETVPRRGYRLTAPVLELPAGERKPRVVAMDGGRQLVGRDRELLRLRELFAETRSGSGGITWVSGEPGIGKTALLERFRSELAALERPPSSGWGNCLELHGSSEPFYGVIDAVSDLLRGPGSEATAAALTAHCPHWCLHHPGRFVGHPACERLKRDGATIEAPVLMRQLCEALIALTAHAPLVLFFEDLQWADEATADFLKVVASRSLSERILVVGTFRAGAASMAPSLISGLVQGSEARAERWLRLPALSEADVVDLVMQEPRGPLVDERLARWLWRTSEGLPLFVVRLLCGVTDEMASALARTESEPRAPLEEVLVRAPVGVSAFIRQQLQGLGVAHRTLLDVAAVIGEEFQASALADVLQLAEAVVERELGILETKHQLVSFLREEELLNGSLTERYRFRHTLVRAELYGLLTAQGRIGLHQRVAEALARPLRKLASHTRGDDAYDNRGQAELAFHWEQARNFPEAILALLKAGDYCDRRAGKEKALVYYARARALLPKTTALEQALLGLFLAQGAGWAKFGLGRLEEARREFRAAGELALELETQQHDPAAEAAFERGFRYLDVEWEDPLVQRPMAMLPDKSEVGVRVLRAEAYFGECVTLGRAERYPELAEVAAELLALGRRSGNQQREAEALAWLGCSQLELGELELAKATLDECLSLTRVPGYLRSLDLSSYARGVLHALQGEFEQAAEYFEAIRGRAVTFLGLTRCLTQLGDICAKQGHIRRALAQHREGLELFRASLGARATTDEGWIYRELGAPREGLELDLRALATLPVDDFSRRRALSYSVVASRARLMECEAARRTLGEIVVHDAIRNSPLNQHNEWLARCEIHAAAREYDELGRLGANWYRVAEAQKAREGMLKAQRFLGLAARGRGDLERARLHLQSALEVHERHPLPLFGVRAYRDLERIELERGERGAAERARRAGDMLFESIAASIEDAGLKLAFQQSARCFRERSVTLESLDAGQ